MLSTKEQRQYHICLHSMMRIHTWQLHKVVPYMGLAATKLAFKVSDKVWFKPVSTATETSYKIKVLLVASLDIILSNKQITKVLISLRGCAGWSPPLLFPNPRRQVFSRQSPYMTGYHGILNIHTGLQIRVRIGKLLSPRFFKKASGILQSPPSVRPSRYLLLNHWTKFNQIWRVSC